SDPRISSPPSSAHTYRLLIFKEHFCGKPGVSQQRRVFQQQRSEIMNRVSRFVNNFLNCFVATTGFNFVCAGGSTTRPTAPPPFFPRAALPLARKRRDSMHLTVIAQGVSKKI
ncbi:hypothetical protein, partial [Burkholderia territorii]|uniref:hypothetical protein n=1 Tax=Burkholderia territorii TaxID=1503055 RepID=UPI001E62E9D7